MKKRISVCLLAAMLLSLVAVFPLGASAEPTQSNVPQTMKNIRDGETMNLVWNDEFDGVGLDETKWNLFDRMWGITTSKEEPYITVKDGHVEMNLCCTGTDSEGNPEWTTNKTLTTWDRMSFQYGYMEVRAKIPNQSGAFPAFWFQSAYQHRTDPNVMTEVDVFEPYGNGFIEGTMHKWYLPSLWESAYAHDWNKPTPYTFPADQVATLGDDYHLYGFGWTSTEIYFTVDGKVFATYDITDTGDFGNGPGNINPAHGKLTGMQCFQDPMVVNFTNWRLLNDTRYPEWTVKADAQYPFTFAIDYVRLYQKPGEGAVYHDGPSEKSVDLVGVQKTEPENGTFDVRFVSEVNKKNMDAEQVGYEISILCNGKVGKTELTSQKVYTSVLAGEKTVTPTDGNYLAAIAIYGIPVLKKGETITFTVRPFLDYENRARIYGAEEIYTLEADCLKVSGDMTDNGVPDGIRWCDLVFNGNS